MKRIFTLCVALMIMLTAVFITPAVNAAGVNIIHPVDFGDSNDYDSGGGYDSYDSYDSYDYDDDDDYYSSGSSDLEWEDILTLLILCAVGAGVYGIYYFFAYIVGGKKKKGNNPPTRHYPPKNNHPTNIQQRAGRNVAIPDRTAEISAIIKERDKNFSAEDMLSFAKDVYVRIQYAWSDRDLSTVRFMLHENLYNQTNQQIKNKLERHIVNKIENVAVSTAYLTTYQKDKNMEYVGVYLNARLTDYEIDEKTGVVLRGNPNARYELRYLLKFVRSANAKTSSIEGALKSHNCPNCGAPLEMTNSGKCIYCNSILTSGEYTWVLTEYSSIRDDYTDKGIIK